MLAGELSYSHVRLITRIPAPTADTDAALVRLATNGTVRQLEHAIRRLQLLDEQERPPPRDVESERGARTLVISPGMRQLRVTLPDVEMAELEAMIEAFIDRSATGPVDTSGLRSCWLSRRADAVMEMARTALGSAPKRAAGADRYMTHVIVNLEDLYTDQPATAELIDGTPIDIAYAQKLACDSSIVAHLYANGFEPLALGRKTKRFTDAQKRAIFARDRHTCRIPGCDCTRVDVHHIRWASNNGPTDIDNGMAGCDRHHTMIHNGDLVVEGDANATLTVRARDGTFIGRSDPPTSLPFL